jgi:hypothetical protein
VNNGYHVKRIYVSLVPYGKTFMLKTLKDDHSCIKLVTIKTINSTWITKKIILVISVDPNISNKTLDTILDDKFRIKPHPI